MISTVSYSFDNPSSIRQRLDEAEKRLKELDGQPQFVFPNVIQYQNDPLKQVGVRSKTSVEVQQKISECNIRKRELHDEPEKIAQINQEIESIKQLQMTEEQEQQLNLFNARLEQIASIIFPQHVQMYKCLEESKDYLESDLKDAPEFYFTDDEYQKFNKTIGDIQNMAVANSKVSKARLEPQSVPLSMPRADEWKVDENLADFIKVNEVRQ